MLVGQDKFRSPGLNLIPTPTGRIDAMGNNIGPVRRRLL